MLIAVLIILCLQLLFTLSLLTALNNLITALQPRSSIYQVRETDGGR